MKMKIGITYDLRSEYLKMGYSEEETAELDKEETIDIISSVLQKAGFETEKIGHFRSLIEKLEHGSRWDIVFNISEGMFGDGRESLVPAILDAYRLPYVFSGPATLAVSLNKYLTKRVVRDAGVPTPEFILVNSEAGLNQDKPGFPLFLKPVSEGTGKGIDDNSIVNNEEEFRKVCTSLLRKFKQPVLVEEFLPGREFTAGIIGSEKDARVIGVIEVCFVGSFNPVYSYENKENWKGRVEYRLTEENISRECAETALRVWSTIGAHDAGRVDLKVGKNGRVQFVEVNPLAGMNANYSDLPILARMHGMEFQELIEEIMKAAIKRIFNKTWVKK